MSDADDESAGPVRAGQDIFEDLRPGKGLQSPKVFVAAEHYAKTRRGLAIAIVAALGVMYLVGTLGFVLGGITFDELIRLVAAFSGVQTLGAAAVGFYFAKDMQ